MNSNRFINSTEEAYKIIEALSGTFSLMNPKSGEILSVSTEFLTKMGYTQQDIDEKKITALDLIESKEIAEKMIAIVLENKHLDFEVNMLSKSGDKIPHIMRSALVEIGGEQYVVNAAFDISKQVKAHEKLRQQQLEITHISRVAAMGELAASFAHELSQPLTAITNNSRAAEKYLQASKDLNDELRDILADITHDAKRAGEIITHLRTLLKKESDDFQEIDLNKSILKIVTLLRDSVYKVEPIIYTDLCEDIPLIYGVEIQIQQVVMNLAMNAADAILKCDDREHEVRISSTCRDGKYAVVTVFDNGAHLSDEILAHVFDPFFSTKSTGLGMGLAISRSIIEAHHGSIQARNCTEGGIEFSFSLPVAVRDS